MTKIYTSIVGLFDERYMPKHINQAITLAIIQNRINLNNTDFLFIFIAKD